MDDTGFWVFVGIFIFFFAILQIMLFFKIWGMTNDIRKMKEKIETNDRVRDAEIAYLTGNPIVAKRILDEYLKSTNASIKENHYSLEPKHIKERILDTYKYLGLEIPPDIEHD